MSTEKLLGLSQLCRYFLFNSIVKAFKYMYFGKNKCPPFFILFLLFVPRHSG